MVKKTKKEVKKDVKVKDPNDGSDCLPVDELERRLDAGEKI